jgi:predicted exporter
MLPRKLFSRPAYIWLLFHALLFMLLGFSLLARGPVRVNTGLFDLLPGSRRLKSAAEADRKLSGRNSREVYILAGNPDFGAAREAAAALYRDLVSSGAFEALSLYLDEGAVSRIAGYFHEYRYSLLDGETRELLENGRAGDIAAEALASAFGAFTFAPLDTLEDDPFLLAGRRMKYFIGSSLSFNVSLKEDVLAAVSEGIWYVMIRGTIFPAGVSVTNSGSAVKKIYAAADGIKARVPGTAFVYSGIPFHSYESSSKAQREISIITSVSLLLILLLFLRVFRSPLPVCLSLAAVGLSLVSASVSVLIFFREIHVLTFVFGTTLIGTCIDYSIHFFVHWRGNAGLKTGTAVGGFIFPGIAMSFASTALCFTALFFAPFTILKQFALFSFAGLLSSFLSVTCLYPYLKKPPGGFLPVFPASRGRGISPKARFPLKLIFVWALIGLSAASLFIHRGRVRIENNIGGLYTMSASLMESEKIAARILNHGSPGWYFIVGGSDPGETLEHEEILLSRLEKEISRGNLQACLGTSLFIPSVERQKKNYEAAKNLLPLAERQYALLGFPPEAAKKFRRDFAGAREKYSLPGDDGLPGYLKDLTSKLWIGESGGQYYSCVVPLHPGDEALFRSLAEEMDFVFFVNKVQDIGGELDFMTRIIAGLLLVSYALIGIMTGVFYPRPVALRICAVPALLFLITAAVLAWLDIPLNFFSASGLVLVFGLGLDYMFYMAESGAFRGLSVFAVLLSFATTALSFGALILSGFAPVHVFGLTVFTGLTAAFISAMVLSGSFSPENQ